MGRKENNRSKGVKRRVQQARPNKVMHRSLAACLAW
jgi:hypothetical protein